MTSIGESQKALWVHTPLGGRQITFEGFAYLPSFSSDHKRLYYLQRSNANRRFVSGELWTTNRENGTRRRLLPDFLMEHYAVSADGKHVLFITADATRHAPLWIGTTDGSVPPRLLVNQDSSRALYAPDGETYFVIDGVRPASGPNPSTYAYIKPSFHANLYRIPLR